jgi:hypothetical protein
MLTLLFFASSVAMAEAPPTFQFESIHSTSEMRTLVEKDFPLGSPRTALRQRFVTEGAATQKVHPDLAGTEKYIYDINLCSYYVWRWNISADFDQGGLLLQAYINGDPVFAAGPQKKDTKKLGKADVKASIYKMVRPRPEAAKGEKALAFMLLDADSNIQTMHDQVLVGAGPTRPDPFNMGKLYVYSGVEPWRSIFDFDVANRIVDYIGDCNKVDQFYEQQKAASKATMKQDASN